MVDIPEVLKKKEFRFIKILNGTKRPMEQNWQVAFNYKYNEDEFQEFLKKSKSYGVACGYGNLAVIDCDEEEVAKEVLLHLPKTLTVKTGSGGFHFYYTIPDLDKKIIMKDNKDKHYGEVQWMGQQVIGSGSLHPNGNIYKTVHNNDVAEIKKEDLLAVIGKYLKTEKQKTERSGLDLDISKVAAKISGLDNVSGGLQGTHPIHGSDGGMNFRIDPDKNVWHCFRHGTGGDALALIAVLEKKLKCEDCVPGVFANNKKLFNDIKNIAIEKYGYNIPDTTNQNIPLFIQQGKKSVFNVEGVVDYLKDGITFIVVRDTTGRKPHIYYYEDGYYQLNGDLKIISEIKKIFRETGYSWKPVYEDSIMKYLSTENVVDRDDIVPPKNLINLNNCIYDIENDKFLSHNSKYFFLYKIPWDYDTTIKKKKHLCKKITEYFESTLEPEFVKLSQEVFGYCLYFGYPIAAIFYLYGTGGNGKSVWIHLLQKLVGDKNVSTKGVSTIVNNRFVSALLYGKLANISGELSDSVLKDTDVLKRLSSGDYIQAEFKGKDGFDFQNKAKVITACNSIPRSTDMSDGWYQRQYIIPFLKKFRGKKEDNTKLKEQLTENDNEMKGLLIWALEGLKRVLQNEKFSYPENKEIIYQMYQRNTSYFIEQNYVKAGFDNYLPVDAIREDYIVWCKKNKIPIDTEQALGRQLTYFNYNIDKIKDEDDNWIRIRRYIKRV